MLPLNPIRKAAWMAHRRCPGAVDWEDLFQECSLAYLEAQESHDPTKGHLPNWAWSVMWGGALSLQQRELRERGELPWQKNGVAILPESTPASPESLLEIVDGMSTEAQQVCRAVLSSPSEFLFGTSKSARGRLCQQLRQEGWTWGKIWSTFREIKAALK